MSKRSKKLIKVAIVGPECTGKTSLAKSLSELYKTNKSIKMQAWQVSKKVNSPTFENPICIKKIIKNKISIVGEKSFKSQGSFFD